MGTGYLSRLWIYSRSRLDLHSIDTRLTTLGHHPWSPPPVKMASRVPDWYFGSDSGFDSSDSDFSDIQDREERANVLKVLLERRDILEARFGWKLALMSLTDDTAGPPESFQASFVKAFWNPKVILTRCDMPDKTNEKKDTSDEPDNNSNDKKDDTIAKALSTDNMSPQVILRRCDDPHNPLREHL